MAITKPPVLPAWADAGDKVQPSNAELSVGWPVSSTPPSRQRFNWALNFVANAVRYFSRRGLVDYDVAETYMIGDCVIGDDGKTYRSLIDTNLAQTPSTQPTKWERWGFRLSELGGSAQTQLTTAFTSSGAAPNFILTPSPALTAYAANQRFRVAFNVAGSGANAINVSTLGAKLLKQYDTSGAKVPAVIAAGQLTDIEYDGVDFVILDPLPAGGLSASAQTIISVTQTLAASAAGKVLVFSGVSAFTVTLPLSASVKSGSVLSFVNTSSAAIIINRQTADTIIFSASAVLTTVALQPGDTLILAADGASTWTQIAGSAGLTYSGLFTSSKTPNGYQKLPSGLILQWCLGASTTVGDSTQVVNFPIAFPTAVLSVSVSTIAGSASLCDGWMQELSGSRTLTGVTTVFQWNGGGSLTGSAAPSVFAIGY